MKDIISSIHENLKRHEKELIIAQSGSTRGGGGEKIRAGQSYLYKKNGMESEVIEIRFADKVTGSFLNQALLYAGRRYPYFNIKLIEKDGDFYIVQNECSMIARRTDKLYPLGHISCGHRLVDVTYFEKSVFISFHHALCDGRGIMPFVETLIWYYCRLRYKSKAGSEGIRLAEDALLPGETDDPFMKKYDYEEKEFISLSREAFAIPEKAEDFAANFRCEIKAEGESYMAACKRVNATPVILLSILMSRAIEKLYPGCGRINANIACDMREALGAPNTFKNCVRTIILPYDEAFARLSMREQAEEWRRILSLQRDDDFCKKEANGMIGLFDKLDTLHSYEKKREVMGFFENMSLDSYIVSYLGQFNIKGNEKYVDEIHLYNSGTLGLGINLISCGESFIIDFKQSFPSRKYAEGFYVELREVGVKCELRGLTEFATPGDGILKREKK